MPELDGPATVRAAVGVTLQPKEEPSEQRAVEPHAQRAAPMSPRGPVPASVLVLLVVIFVGCGVLVGLGGGATIFGVPAVVYAVARLVAATK